MFDIMKQEHLADLHFRQDARSGLQAVIAIHSTRKGPALGGCRFLPYPSTEAAVQDAARPARGMSYKAALADIAHGGGKAVIIQPSHPYNRRALMEAFGEFIDSLHGRYITAVDSGTNTDDMDVIATRTHFVSSTSYEGNPSSYTARGVMAGISAAVKYRLGNRSLYGVHVAIQGLGQVGLALARQLSDQGAKLTVTDADNAKIKQCLELTDAKAIAPEEIYAVDCDVFSPCALGGVINDETLSQLHCKIIAGSANNQLAREELGQQLQARDILYAPDYAINAGGLIYAALHHRHASNDNILKKIDGIATTLSDIFQQANHSQMATNLVANRLAEAKLYLQSASAQSWYQLEKPEHATAQRNAMH